MAAQPYDNSSLASIAGSLGSMFFGPGPEQIIQAQKFGSDIALQKAQMAHLAAQTRAADRQAGLLDQQESALHRKLRLGDDVERGINSGPAARALVFEQNPLQGTALSMATDENGLPKENVDAVSLGALFKGIQGHEVTGPRNIKERDRQQKQELGLKALDLLQKQKDAVTKPQGLQQQSNDLQAAQDELDIAFGLKRTQSGSNMVTDMTTPHFKVAGFKEARLAGAPAVVNLVQNGVPLAEAAKIVAKQIIPPDAVASKDRWWSDTKFKSSGKEVAPSNPQAVPSRFEQEQAKVSGKKDALSSMLAELGLLGEPPLVRPPDTSALDNAAQLRGFDQFSASMGRPNYGPRVDGTQKGNGFLGPIQMNDGSGKVATEMSIGVNIGGKDVEIPSFVPTLSAEEIQYLQKGGDPRVNKSIMQKAVQHATQRIQSGLSPFADSQQSAAPTSMGQIAAQAPAPQQMSAVDAAIKAEYDDAVHNIKRAEIEYKLNPVKKDKVIQIITDNAKAKIAHLQQQQ